VASAAASRQAPSASRACAPLALDALFDNDGISGRERPGDGAFNIWGNTFPAECLPASGAIVVVEGIPFRFPPKEDGEPNNVRCRGQFLRLEEAVWDWVYVLAAAERRSEEAVLVRFGDGSERPEWLRVSDFWPETHCRFGEPLAFAGNGLHYPRHAQPNMRPAIWQSRVPIGLRRPVVGVTLPENPAIHLFAATLVREPPTAR
jgi:hypothetical protein